MTGTETPEDIERIIESIRPCFQCGICASSCPVFRVAPEINPRHAIDEIVKTGEIEPDGSEWSCAYCLMCEQRCPMGVSLAHLLVAVKNVSTQKGSAPEGLPEIIHSILSTGVIAQGMDLDKMRQKYDLPSLKRPTAKEVRKVLELTGATDLLELYQSKEARSE